jgi:preprotein translocase subunit YajC
MNLITYLLMTPPETEDGGILGQLGSFLPLLLIVLVFYLFFIRPQMKKNKNQQKFRQGLQKGDLIVTTGGIHGKILEVQETTVVIEVEGQNRLKIEKSVVNMDAKEINKK